MSSYGVKSPTDPIPAGEGEVQQQNVCLMLNAQPNLSLIDGCELPSGITKCVHPRMINTNPNAPCCWYICQHLLPTMTMEHMGYNMI
jgi:hypothetical protein